MKGWLKGPTGLVPLSTTRPTTIGRECCDVVIPCSAVDSKHAIIEYDETIGCFILRDLNTVFGTYVNGCHVNKTSIRLSPGDVIKIGFGQTAVQYEFDADAGCSCRHLHCSVDKPNELKDMQFSSSQTCLKTMFPHLATSTLASPIASNAPIGHLGASRLPLSQVRSSSQTSLCGTMPKLTCSIHDEPVYKDCHNSLRSNVCMDDIMTKERQVADLSEEVERLQRSEVESLQKDCHIKDLVSQVECLQTQLRIAVSNGCNRVEVEALQKRISDLENQLQLRIKEIADINEKLFKVKTSSQKQLDDKVLEGNCLREDLERLRKEKNVLSGLLTQIQKDLTMKDKTICSLTKDVFQRNNELSDKNVQLASFQNSHCVVASHKQLQSDLDVKQREVDSLVEKLRKSEAAHKTSKEEIISLNKALDKSRAELHQEKQQQRTLQSHSDDLSSKLKEANKLNQSTSQQLTQTTNMLLRLQQRMQRVLSLRYHMNMAEEEMMLDDEKDLTDDQIVLTLKKIMEEGKNLSNQLKEAKDICKNLELVVKSITSTGEQLKDELKASVGAVEPNPATLVSMLHQELNAVHILVTPPVLKDFRHILASMIQVQLNRQNELLNSLEGYGFNVRLSDEGLTKHIADLHLKYEASQKQCQEAQLKLEESTHRFQREMEDAKDRGRKEVEARSWEKMESLMRESEAKLQKERADVEQREKEKYEDKVGEEKLKITRLEECIRCLEQEIAEKLEELNFYKEKDKQHVLEVESYQKLEAELREEVVNRRLSMKDAKAALEQAISKRYEEEVTSLKEQNVQLSATLTASQERLSRANKKIHRQQLELASLRTNSSGPANLSASASSDSKGSFEVSRVNERLRTEIKQHQAEIKKLTRELDCCKSVIAEKIGIILDLEAKLQTAKEKNDQTVAQSQVTAELLAIGAECKGNRHKDTLSKQKDALIELRRRIKCLVKESAEPATSTIASSNSAEPNQSHLVRPTGAEEQNDDRESVFDTNTRRPADEREAVSVLPSTDLRPTDELREPVAQTSVQSAVDNKIKDKDSEESLELTEKAYSSLLKAIAESLPTGKVADKISLLTNEGKNCNKKELMRQRQDVCLEVQMELFMMNEKINDYESTIQKCEMELTKLRNADVLLEEKGWQIDGLTSDVRSLVDEVACLHESLTKVREELRREKRNNATAKEKKVSSANDKTRTSGTIVRHTSFNNNSSTKVKPDRTKTSEKVRRRSGDMMLKEEMRKCERNLEKVQDLDLKITDSDFMKSDLIDENQLRRYSEASI